MADKGTVGDYVTLQRGITYKGNLVGKPGPALLGLGSIRPGGGFREGDFKTYGGECPQKLMLFPGDLFVSLKGATKDGKMIGSVARVPPSVPSGRLTQDTVKLEFRENNPKAINFLYWILRTPQYRDYCDGRATGSAVVALSRDDFLDYPVPPMTKTRLSIVELLKELDDKIELNRRMNATLEAMARALFQSWFVDLDLVRAKIDGRQPVGMDAATASLFPDSFQDSEAGHIPKGWTVRSLSSLTRYLSRGIGPSYLEQGGVCVLNQKCIRDHRVDFTKSRRHDSTVKPINDRALQIHDILVNSTGMGTLGRVAQLFYLPEPAIVDSHVTIVRAGLDTDPLFLGINLTGRETEIEALGEGSTGQTELSRNRLGELKIITPSFRLQQSFGSAVRPLLARISKNETQSHTLAALRDTLLPKLLSGELSVGDGIGLAESKSTL